MNLKFNKWIILVMISTVAFSLALRGTIISITPSIEITDAIYEINDHGDLMIRLTGNLNGFSVDTSQFRLEIAEEFEIDTFVDGSPIIKMMENGVVQDMSVKETQISMVFILQTFEATPLPESYTLKVSSTTFQYTEVITPQWPTQPQNQTNGGSGASIQAYEPYITGFYAYDTTKASTERVKTYIRNPSFYPIRVDKIQYKLRWGNPTYPPPHNIFWEDWTPAYSENTYIEGGQTRVIYDYLNPIFTAPSGKSYALNTGRYQVTQVVASGAVPPYWSDDYNPSSSQGEFYIDFPSNYHPVFVVHLYDYIFQYFYAPEMGTTVSEWFNYIETWDFAYSLNEHTNLKELKKVDFISKTFLWDPPTPNMDNLFNWYLADAGGAAIKNKYSEWQSPERVPGYGQPWI